MTNSNPDKSYDIKFVDREVTEKGPKYRREISEIKTLLLELKKIWGGNIESNDVQTLILLLHSEFESALDSYISTDLVDIFDKLHNVNSYELPLGKTIFLQSAIGEILNKLSFSEKLRIAREKKLLPKKLIRLLDKANTHRNSLVHNRLAKKYDFYDRKTKLGRRHLIEMLRNFKLTVNTFSEIGLDF